MRDKTYKPTDHIIVTTPINHELHKKLRLYAAENEMSLKATVTLAIRTLVSK